MANYADSQFQFPQATFDGANSPRLPWNNFIYPGNYVAGLNAYRDQCVQSFPGVNFFRGIGAYVLPQGEDEVAAGTVPLVLLSPDLREDDKPRTDRAFVIRASNDAGKATPYRVAINVVNLAGNSSTITTDPTTLGSAAPIFTSAAESAAGLTDGAFLLGGEVNEFQFDTSLTELTADTTIEATVGAHELKKVDPLKEAAILVEVCYFRNAPAPTSDDVRLPYYTESGQSTQ